MQEPRAVSNGRESIAVPGLDQLAGQLGETLHAHQAPVTQHSEDFAAYAAIKMMRYERIVRLWQRGELDPAHVRRASGGVSTRDVHRYLFQGGRGRSRRMRFAELFDVTSYYVRNRLDALHRAGILGREGQGFRGAQEYAWEQPVDRGAMVAYAALAAALSGFDELILDLFRAQQAFGHRLFTTQEFQATFRERRTAFLARKTFRIVTESLSRSPAYTRFLRERLGELVRANLVAPAFGRLALTPQGLALARRFEGFVTGDWSDPDSGIVADQPGHVQSVHRAEERELLVRSWPPARPTGSPL